MMVIISMVLLVIFIAKHVVFSHVVIMRCLEVIKSTALNKIIRLLLIIILKMACHLGHVRHAGNGIKMNVLRLLVIGVQAASSEEWALVDGTLV